MKPEFRELDEGVIVVDLGPIWFRCLPNGEIITKTARNGKVEARTAYPGEREIAEALIRGYKCDKILNANE